MKEERSRAREGKRWKMGRWNFGREVCAALQPPGGCWCRGTKMVEGIKTAVLRRYLLSLRFRGLCPAISTGIIISAGKFFSGDERSSPRRHRRRIAIKLFAMGEKPPDLPSFSFFFFHCSLESRGNFGNYFVHAAQFAFRNKKVRTHVFD